MMTSAPWARVGRRDEVRRHLEGLAASAEPLNEADRDLVRFYFRASDPALYPPAAMAIGCRLEPDSEWARWLAAYAGSRGIALGGIVPLSRTRSARRVLMTAAAAWARSPEAWRASAQGSPPPQGPLAPLPDAAPVDHPQDLVAYLRALRILLEGPEPSDAHRLAAGDLVSRLATEGEPLRERSVALRWGELLRVAAAAGALPSGRPEELGGQVLETLARAFRDEAGPGLPRRLGLLASMGAAVSASGGLASPDRLPVPLRDPVGECIGEPEGGAPGRRARFVDALGALADPGDWWRKDEDERAVAAHVLLRDAVAGVVPEGEMHRLLDALGFPPSPGPPARIVRLLAERAGVRAAELVDATLLHSLEDDRILVELVPDGPPGESGAVLADAVEHRIRLGLLTQPGFRPEALLARIEARRPHPQLYRMIRAVVGDREFRGRSGEAVPLAEWLDALASEAENLRSGRNVPEAPAVGGTLGSIREEIRRGLRHLLAEEDPAEAARGLAGLLEGGLLEGSGADAGGDRTPDLRGLLRAADPGDTSTEAALHDHAEAIRADALASLPEDLFGAPAGRGAAEALRLRFAVLDREVARRLPAAEGMLLEALLRRLDEDEAAWARALSTVEGVWRRSRESSGEPESRWERAFRAVEGIELAAHRRRLYGILWRTLARDRRPGGASGSVRAGKERLMGWAVRVGDILEDERDRDGWLGAVARHWTTMIEEGMAAGLDTRVAGLLRDPGPRELARLPGVDDVLERARIWLFDCYRLGDAARASRILNHRRGRGAVAALPRDLLAFFGHYSPLWLALLVGAILMLDFGDAWTAMAEVGDVRGIAITFSLGVLGAFGYTAAELQSRVSDAHGDPVWPTRLRRVLRVLAFVGVSLLYTVGLVTLLWWLLSGTDEVVHGDGAVLHVVVWSGFTLFIGVFFGLMAKDSA